MIGWLTGLILEKRPPQVLLNVNGVGYEVDLPATAFTQLPALGEQLTLHTHLIVREDAHQLYGFLHLRDRKLFRDLLKVNGIGAKSALGILSGMDVSTFVQCILDNDLKLLTNVPGVGKKTAERLVVEMRDRLAKWSEEGDLIGRGESRLTANSSAPGKRAETDAVSALIALGYRLPEASKMVSKVADEGLSSAELIKLALQSLAKN